MLEKDTESKITQIAIDVAIIKDKLPGLICKVDRHDKYFYISYGCLLVVGVVLGVKVA